MKLVYTMAGYECLSYIPTEYSVALNLLDYKEILVLKHTIQSLALDWHKHHPLTHVVAIWQL